MADLQWKEGEEVEAQWDDGYWYFAIVEIVVDGQCTVLFPDFAETHPIPIERLRKIATLPTTAELVDPAFTTPDDEMVARRKTELLADKRRRSLLGTSRGMSLHNTLIVETTPADAKGTIQENRATEMVTDQDQIDPPFCTASFELMENKLENPVVVEVGTWHDEVGHLFAPLCDELQKGLALLRGFASFLKKVSDNQIKFADDLLKTIKETKSERQTLLLANNYKELSEGVFFVEDYYSDLHSAQRKFAKEILEEVVTKITDFCDKKEKTFAEIVTQETTAANFVRAHTIDMWRYHSTAQKNWKSLCSMSKKQQDAAAEAASSQDLKKQRADEAANSRKLDVAVKQAVPKFEKYESQRDVVIAYQAEYLEKFKHILEQLEATEKDRVAFLAQQFKLIQELEAKYFQHPTFAKEMQTHFKDMSSAVLVASLVRNLQKRLGLEPVVPFPISFMLPCKASQLASGDWQNTSAYISAIAANHKGDDDDDDKEDFDDTAAEDRESTKSPRGKGSFSAKLAPPSPRARGQSAGHKSGGGISKIVRGLVSKKKKRFKEDGYDLDLTYVGKQIIAMGFPAEKLAGMYRNPMPEVQRFFNDRHGDKYKVYNLCAELEYDHAKFDNRVARYPFLDHTPSQFVLIKPFCEDVHQWLTQGETYLAAIHCKAGKGRTGYLISCYLVHAELQATAEDALSFYASARTLNRKGVTIPSQIRFVHYYEQYHKDQQSVARGNPAMIPEQRPLRLMRIVIHGLPFDFIKNPSVITFKAEKQLERGETSHLAVSLCTTFNLAKNYAIMGTVQNKDEMGILLCEDDILFKFKGAACKFHFWFNTRFVPESPPGSGKFVFALPKSEIDKALKDKHHELFPPDFQVVCEFEAFDASKVVSTLLSPKADRPSAFDRGNACGSAGGENVSTTRGSEKGDTTKARSPARTGSAAENVTSSSPTRTVTPAPAPSAAPSPPGQLLRANSQPVLPSTKPVSKGAAPAIPPKSPPKSAPSVPPKK